MFSGIFGTDLPGMTWLSLVSPRVVYELLLGSVGVGCDLAPRLGSEPWPCPLAAGAGGERETRNIRMMGSEYVYIGCFRYDD